MTRQWHVIDAQDVVLGKLASKAAMLLMGKTKPIYTPFLDTGDHVIVINAEKVRLTGRKEDRQVYRHFTGYPGGLVEKSLKRVRAERPTRMVEDAILGMLPKTKLGKQMYPQTEGLCGRPASARGAETRRVDRKIASRKVRFSGSDDSSIFGYGPPQEIGGSRVLAARQGRDQGQRPRVRELFPDRKLRAPWCGSRWLATETMDKFDLLILADGGGVAGQAGAARLGISRALVEFNAELRSRLKKLGFLTRDPRAARAQEVRPEGRPQAVPVLQTLSLREARRCSWFAFRALLAFNQATSGSVPRA